MTKSFLLILFILITESLFAQKEANNWCFGEQSFVTFNSGKPEVLKKISIYARYGAANISSSDGKLLFYTEGINIWDSTHYGGPNFKFSNSYNCIQSAIIVPWPDSSHLYFIFTPSYGSKDSLKYTVVNMKLRGGLGDIINDKKDVKIPALSSGKINVVKHANKRDYWAVAPLANTDSLVAFLITPYGVNNQPVFSKTGFKFRTGNYSYSNVHGGYFKLSPDGKKLCNINNGDSSLLADFDASSGKVSNIWLFNSAFSDIGLEFSAKSNYLYVADAITKRLSQYDLTSKTKQAFLYSRKTVDSSSNNNFQWSCFQLATDGKIYISQYNPGSFDYLHVIHSPDSAGIKAHFERNVVFIGTSTSYVHTGLPDMVQSFFHKPSFGVKQNCANDTVFFTIKDTYQLDSVHWNFGDNASGALNFSTKTTNIFHHYKKLGNYKVRLISFHKTYTDTIYETFLLKPLKPNIGKDTNFCKSKYLLLSPDQEYASYKWSNSQTVKSIYVTNPGTYILTVSDYNGCKGFDTIKISKPIVKANFTVNDSNQCFRVNDFKLKENTTYTGGLRQKSSWFFKDSIISQDSLANLSFNNIGSYQIKLVSESFGGCKDSITKTLNVSPNINIDFVINDSSQCLNTNRFNFTNTTTDTGIINYQWDLGDQTMSSQKNIVGKTYAKDSLYKISLITTTTHNCKDTISKKISILPNPKANFGWDLACSRTVTNFLYTGSKPIKNFRWNFNNEATSSIENPSHKFATVGNLTTILITSSDNGCTDTLEETIEIKPQSKADFTAVDVCENDSAVFINKSQDATGYIWKFGDGVKSTKESPKHFYSVGGVSQTFNVSLVAIVKDGCSDSITKAISINTNPKSDYSYTKSGKSFNFTPAQSGNSKYRWLFGDGDSSISATANHTYTDALTEHTVCLKTTNAAGCISETCKLVSTVRIYNISNLSGFKLYPNPNSGNFTIEIENEEKETLIEIYNAIGALVKKVEGVGKITTLDLETEDGIYLVRVKNGINVYTQKVVLNN